MGGGNLVSPLASGLLPDGNSYDTSLGRHLALRVYADTRPRCLEVAQLQKGLVLIYDGKELIEEGMGFGVPVALYSDKTYFPGSAQVSLREEGEKKVIVKRFSMDMISRKALKNGLFIDMLPYRLFSNSLARLYREHPSSRKMIFPLIVLRNVIGLRTRFSNVESRGEITVTYEIWDGGIHIEADFSKIKHVFRCKKVLLLNEQGSTFFRRFLDSTGLSLLDGKIGAWDLVRADWAYLSDLNNNLGFCLESLPNSRLFRGREYIKGRLSWAGMGYEVNPQDSFRYTLQIRQEEG